jgi:ribosome biogenesis GTPase
LSVLGWDAGWRGDLERELEPARVMAVHRGALELYTAAGVVRARPPAGAGFAAVEVAVGDWVGFADGAVRSVLPRRTALLRGGARRSTRPQTLVANIDLVLLVASLGGEVDLEWIERCLVAIWESGAAPEIVLSKADRIDDPRPFVEQVETVAAGAPIHVVSALSGAGCERLQRHIEPGATAVLLGSSGVGKSTLVNRFVGHEQMAVKEVREDDDEGRHTTSHRELILLPGGGIVIDTPGIRELQLWDASESGMSEAFSDVEELAAECRFNDCTHTSEPGCAVLAAVASGDLTQERLQSWFKLQRELRAIAMRHDHLLRKEETRKWKLLSKDGKARARRR